MWTCKPCGLENSDNHYRCLSCDWFRPVDPSYPVIATDDPCCDPECGNIIQPGQLYVTVGDGPQHIYCGSRRRRQAQTTSYDWPF